MDHHRHWSKFLTLVCDDSGAPASLSRHNLPKSKTTTTTKRTQAKKNQTMTTKWLVASSFFLLLAVSNGLDVELVSTTCDESLPVTADIYLQCSTGGARCTFGESSEIYGSCALKKQNKVNGVCRILERLSSHMICFYCCCFPCVFLF